MRLSSTQVLTAIIALLAIIASATPLFVDLYARDPAFAKGAQLGTDLVTLVIAVPLLLVGAWLAAKGSLRGRILWTGMLAYMLYAYIYYLLGAAMNELFFAYVLLCALPIYALIPLLRRETLQEIGAAFGAAVPARPVAVWIFLYAALLAGVWVTLWYINLFVDVSGGMGLPSEAVHLVASVDLTVFCPALIVIGTKLWQRRPEGIALGAATMVMSGVYPLVLIATAPFQDRLGVADAWATVPLWTGLAAGSFIGLFAMLRHLPRKA